MTEKLLISDVIYTDGYRYHIFYDYDMKRYTFECIGKHSDKIDALFSRILNAANNTLKNENHKPEHLNVSFREDTNDGTVYLSADFVEPKADTTLLTRFLVSYDGSLVYTKHGYGTLIDQTPEITRLIEQLTNEIEKQV